MAIPRPSVWTSSIEPTVRNAPSSVRISGVDTSSIPDMRFNDSPSTYIEWSGRDLTAEALRRNELAYSNLLGGIKKTNEEPDVIIDVHKIMSGVINDVKKIPFGAYKKKFIEVMKK